MRKILILAGAAHRRRAVYRHAGQGRTRLQCVKLGSAPFCTSGVTQCTFMGGGVCVLPCDYRAPKMTKHYKHHRRHAAKKMGKKTAKKKKM